MGQERITQVKLAITKILTEYLHEEGIELYVAANDNMEPDFNSAIVGLESIDDMALGGSELLSEIRVILRVQGKPWRCDALVNGIYLALQPHYITQRELTFLLMSLHVEVLEIKPRKVKKRAVMRYIVEENVGVEDTAHPVFHECMVCS